MTLYISDTCYRDEHMFEYLTDTAGDLMVEPDPASTTGGAESVLGAYMSGYQKRRQRAYDRARRMVGDRRFGHGEVEDAKLEAAMVQAEAQISRARGEQLVWIRNFLATQGVLTSGYRDPVDFVVARADVRRQTAKDLVYLAKRLTDHQIAHIRAGVVSFGRVLKKPA